MIFMIFMSFCTIHDTLRDFLNALFDMIFFALDMVVRDLNTRKNDF